MTSEQAHFLLDSLLPQINQEWGITRKVLSAIPNDDTDYRPDPKARTALEIAWHLVSSEAWLLEGILQGEFAMEESPWPDDVKTIADCLAWRESNVPPLVEKLLAAPDEKLTTPISFFGLMNDPAVTYLNLMVLHTVHHRGQISVYVRPMGGKLPSIYGGSADEPFEMPQ